MQDKSTYVFFMAVLLGYMALGATAQLLPFSMPAHFAAGPLLIASVIGFSSLAAACSRPFAGIIADQGFGVMVALVGSILGFLGALGHVLHPQLQHLMVARLLLGAGEGVLFTGAVTWVLSRSPQQHRATLAGWFGLSMWGGLSLGPVVVDPGHLVFIIHASQRVYEVFFSWLDPGRHGFPLLHPLVQNGCTDSVSCIDVHAIAEKMIAWKVVVLLAGCGLFFSGLAAIHHMTALRLHPPIAVVRRRMSWKKQLGQILHLPSGAWSPGFAFLLTSYGYGTVNSLLILKLVDAHLQGEHVVLSLFAVCFLIMRVLGSPLLRYYKGLTILSCAIGFEVLGLLLLATTEPLLIMVGTVISGMSISMLYPSFVSVLLRRTDPDQQGTAIGMMTSFWDLGLLSAGILGGLCAEWLSFSWVFVLSALLACSALSIIFIMNKECNYDFSTIQ